MKNVLNFKLSFKICLKIKKVLFIERKKHSKNLVQGPGVLKHTPLIQFTVFLVLNKF